MSEFHDAGVLPKFQDPHNFPTTVLRQGCPARGAAEWQAPGSGTGSHELCRRALGKDHPASLRIASYLAADLRVLGRCRAARALDEDTLKRSRRVLGDDHPDALRLAENLAEELSALRETQWPTQFPPQPGSLP